MADLYEVHRATCQACLAAHLAKESRPLKAADLMYLVDASPDGFEPDPRMVTTRKE